MEEIIAEGVENTIEEGSILLDKFMDFVDRYLVGFIIDVVLAMMVLLIGLKLVKFFTSRLEKGKLFSKMDSNVGALIVSSLKISLNSLVIIIAVQILGVPSATIIAAIGSCGLAVGLALQGGLSNIAGGVMIMIFKPFHYRDYICTAVGEGYVEEIGLFYTKLETLDHRSVNIPNSVLSSTTVTNLSVKKTRRLDIEVSLAYGTDIDLARKTLIRCAETHEHVLKHPEPVVLVSSHNDSSVTFILRVYVKFSEYWQVKFDLMESTLKAVNNAGLEIPFPQVDVHVKEK